MQSTATILFIIFISTGLGSLQGSEIANPAIDMAGYFKISAEAAKQRGARRLNLKTSKIEFKPHVGNASGPLN